MLKARIYAAALVSTTSLFPVFAQTSFTPKYIPYTDASGVVAGGLPELQQDFNNDGIPDFMNGAYTSFAQLLSAGGGNYKGSQDGGEGVVSGDFNQDGNADYLKYPGYYPSGTILCGSATLCLAYGNGKGQYTVKAAPNLPGLVGQNTSHSLLLGQATDVNGDGRPDLLLLYLNQNTSTVSLQLWINNGSGFTDKGAVYQFPIAAGASLGVVNDDYNYTPSLGLLLGDFDGDGHADVAVTILTSAYNGDVPQGASLIVLYGNGKGGFTPKVSYLNSPDYLTFAPGDMNDDGRTDMVAVGSIGPNSGVFYFQSQPGRKFTTTAIPVGDLSTTIWPYVPPILADFDGNGYKDIAVSTLSPDPNSNQVGFRVLFQKPSQTWQIGSLIASDTFSEPRDWQPYDDFLGGDYNHDGKPDVALFTGEDALTHPNNVALMLNTGGKPVGACAAPISGIHVCSPGATSASPVKFSFSATSFYPLRKMEIWVDGVKKSESYHVFANEGFSDVSLPVSSGTHTVSFFAGTYDGGVTKKTISLRVP